MIPETVDRIDQSRTAKVIQDQGFVGVLLIVLIAIITYAALWVAPTTIKQISTDTRADVRDALLEMNSQHAKERESTAAAFSKEQDRLERLLGGDMKLGNPVAGAP